MPQPAANGARQLKTTKLGHCVTKHDIAQAVMSAAKWRRTPRPPTRRSWSWTRRGRHRVPRLVPHPRAASTRRTSRRPGSTPCTTPDSELANTSSAPASTTPNRREASSAGMIRSPGRSWRVVIASASSFSSGLRETLEQPDRTKRVRRRVHRSPSCKRLNRVATAELVDRHALHDCVARRDHAR